MTDAFAVNKDSAHPRTTGCGRGYKAPPPSTTRGTLFFRYFSRYHQPFTIHKPMVVFDFSCVRAVGVLRFQLW